MWSRDLWGCSVYEYTAIDHVTIAHTHTHIPPTTSYLLSLTISPHTCTTPNREIKPYVQPCQNSVESQLRRRYQLFRERFPPARFFRPFIFEVAREPRPEFLQSFRLFVPLPPRRLFNHSFYRRLTAPPP